MLYILHGTDTHKAREKLHELLGILMKKRPDSEIFRMTLENWNGAQFEELLVSRGLFDQKYIVVMDNVCENKDIKEYVVERIGAAREAEHVFLMLEGKIDAATLKKLEKIAEKVQEFYLPEAKKESPKIFSVTEGLVRRDGRHLWISYTDLVSKGAVAEEIHGILFWQVKNMILAAKTKNQKESGLAPFVYSKSVAGARKFTITELVNMSEDLIGMTHAVRQGKGDLDVMMEKWMLTLV